MIRDSSAIVAIHDPARTSGGTHEALRTADTMRRPVIRMNIATRTVTMSLLRGSPSSPSPVSSAVSGCARWRWVTSRGGSCCCR